MRYLADLKFVAASGPAACEYYAKRCRRFASIFADAVRWIKGDLHGADAKTENVKDEYNRVIRAATKFFVDARATLAEIISGLASVRYLLAHINHREAKAQSEPTIGRSRGSRLERRWLRQILRWHGHLHAISW